MFLVEAESANEQESTVRPEHVRLGLLAIWLAFIASSAFWVPIYRGTGSGEGLVIVYVLIAAGVAFWVRERAASTSDAVLSALPNILFVAIAAIAGALQSGANDGRFGEPLYVYFGAVLLGSWAIVVLATAIASRTRWNRIGGLLLGLTLTVVGYGLMTFQVN